MKHGGGGMSNGCHFGSKNPFVERVRFGLLPGVSR